jgi:hypothetical protein
MRIKTMAALGIATAAVATGLAIGGAAYAGDGAGGSPAVYQIVQDGPGTPAGAPEDCPEKGGAGPGGTGPGTAEPGGAESGGTESGGTTPQEDV